MNIDKYVINAYIGISIYHALIFKITHSQKLSAFFHALNRNPRLNTGVTSERN